MNQILSIDNSKKEKVRKNNTRNNGPVEITSILKFFSIAILVFGILMVASGSYSMYKETTEKASTTKPSISLEQTTKTEISVKVSHDKALEQLSYSWNNDNATQIECNGKRQIESKIELPVGTNTLKIYAKDINGQETELSRVFTVEKDIEINIEASGNNIILTASGKNILQYITYRWDEEEETKIDINDYNTEQTIEIPKGLHTLTVIAVDENNKTETQEQEVNGVTKPELQITTDGSNFIINASDEQGIKKVEFIINDEEQYVLNLNEVLPLEERKEFNYSFPLNDGENIIQATVYNENDVSEVLRARFNK